MKRWLNEVEYYTALVYRFSNDNENLKIFKISYCLAFPHVQRQEKKHKCIKLLQSWTRDTNVMKFKMIRYPVMELAKRNIHNRKLVVLRMSTTGYIIHNPDI